MKSSHNPCQIKALLYSSTRSWQAFGDKGCEFKPSWCGIKIRYCAVWIIDMTSLFRNCADSSSCISYLFLRLLASKIGDSQRHYVFSLSIGLSVHLSHSCDTISQDHLDGKVFKFDTTFTRKVIRYFWSEDKGQGCCDLTSFPCLGLHYKTLMKFLQVWHKGQLWLWINWLEFLCSKVTVTY